MEHIIPLPLDMARELAELGLTHLRLVFEGPPDIADAASERLRRLDAESSLGGAVIATLKGADEDSDGLNGGDLVDGLTARAVRLGLIEG